MLLSKIEVTGFKRLKSVSTHVGRKTIAVVGPNEAGKSSLLSALRLLDNDDPVPPAVFTRSLRREGRAEDEDVVVLWYALDEDQRQGLQKLPLETIPTHYRRHKQVSGLRPYSFHPLPRVTRDLDAQAAAELSSEMDALRSHRGIAEDSPDPQFEQDVAHVLGALNASDGLDVEAWERVSGPILRGESPWDAEAGVAIRTYDAWRRPDRKVQPLVRAALQPVEPEFAMFGDLERSIRADNNIDDPTTAQSVALNNLLAVAELTLEQLQANRNDRAYVRQLIDDANERLKSFFTEHWRQEQIAVGLDLDGDNLRIMVKDLREGSAGWLDITDRSDGLRVFVALATFLHRRGDRTPPILLIDEAEQHLHLNAQSDLIRMLQQLEQIRQVIYTTHSPGCLPADIGNGVRFVEPIQDGESRVRHDFWSLDTATHVGFNPLLLAMGAGAAAFSGLRSALLVEGAADMLLLPTLIKLAVGAAELEYQIAPGIAVASKSDMQRLDLIASRVAFLVDGDKPGGDWAKQLTQAGVPADRIMALPKGMALEDLLDVNFYLATVRDVVGEIDLPSESELSGGPIKAKLARWAAEKGVNLPGPIAASELILGAHETGRRAIVLSETGQATLSELHDWVSKTLLNTHHS